MSLYIQVSLQDPRGAEFPWTRSTHKSTRPFAIAEPGGGDTVSGGRARSRRRGRAARTRAVDIDLSRAPHEERARFDVGHLERRVIGEIFKLVDSARLPATPSVPIGASSLARGRCRIPPGVTMMLAGRTGSLQRFKKALARS